MTKHKQKADSVVESAGKTVEQKETAQAPEHGHADLLHDEDLMAAAAESKTAGAILRRLFSVYRTKKKLSIPLTVLGVALLLGVVPVSRYAIAGLFITREYVVTIVDATTHKPVVKAEVSLAGKRVETNTEGKAVVSVKPGSKKITVSKKYYTSVSRSLVVNIGRSGNASEVVLTATGRQVPIMVTNKITGKPLEGVLLQAADSETRTDKNGEALFVLPTNLARQKAQISHNGYTSRSVELSVTDTLVAENKLELTPSGRVFFLSNQSGKIDVVSTNLDGSDRKVVVAGTGREDRNNTILLASRDWKYLAFLARRDSDKNKLYLIDAQSGQISGMDEGNAVFTPSGWSDHSFVYTVTRVGLEDWQPKKYAIKSFDADKKQLHTLEENQASGTGYYNHMRQTFSSIYVLGHGLVYATGWDGISVNNQGNGKQASLIQVQPDGSGRKVIKEFTFPAPTDYYYFSHQIALRAYEPQALYIRMAANNDKALFYEFEDGAVKDVKDYTDQQFYDDPYKTFLISPNGKSAFWSESRDGKTAFLIGDEEAKNEKAIASFPDQQAYGWYTDEYVLVTKKDSELYIMSASGGQELKVADYYKPYRSIEGYGYGYGGI